MREIATLKDELARFSTRLRDADRVYAKNPKPNAKREAELDKITAMIAELGQALWDKGWECYNLDETKTPVAFDLRRIETPAPDPGGVSFDHLPPPTETERGAKVWDLT